MRIQKTYLCAKELNKLTMLNTLAALDGASALKRKITQYARPELLVIDEVGYLSYANRQADLLFEVIRYTPACQHK